MARFMPEKPTSDYEKPVVTPEKGRGRRGGAVGATSPQLGSCGGRPQLWTVNVVHFFLHLSPKIGGQIRGVFTFG